VTAKLMYSAMMSVLEAIANLAEATAKEYRPMDLEMASLLYRISDATIDAYDYAKEMRDLMERSVES